MAEKSRYYSKEWWMGHLGSIFPENRSWPDPTWKVNKLFIDLEEMHWYRNGDYLLGIYVPGDRPPRFSLKILGTKTEFQVVFDFARAQEHVTFLEALAENDKFMLCFSLPFAVPFMEHWMASSNPVTI